MISGLQGYIDRAQVLARRRKMQDFFRLCRPGPDTSVLEVGVLSDDRSEGTNLLLKEYPHPHRLTALAIEDCRELSLRHPQVSFVRYGGRFFPFPDSSFDVCHANAVVEHVGNWQRQCLFVSEMVRVARRGFFTTPNRWFPLELHTRIPLLHFLPWSCFVRVCALLGKEDQIKGVALLDRRRVEELVGRCPLLEYKVLPNQVMGLVATYSVFWQRRTAG